MCVYIWSDCEDLKAKHNPLPLRTAKEPTDRREKEEGKIDL